MLNQFQKQINEDLDRQKVEREVKYKHQLHEVRDELEGRDIDNQDIFNALYRFNGSTIDAVNYLREAEASGALSFSVMQTKHIHTDQGKDQGKKKKNKKKKNNKDKSTSGDEKGNDESSDEDEKKEKQIKKDSKEIEGENIQQDSIDKNNSSFAYNPSNEYRQERMKIKKEQEEKRIQDEKEVKKDQIPKEKTISSCR
ncbi:MAG: hypothetical protein EZS28_000591 [Streblomastix strix]|uniref:Uncharacterized protein n=1 Tax=Streblomastix strix TaxID=222440 RepID=A0A5J4X9R8_9EUKA|nr:MAG: hypothetical protein EZS28_000591 [Streblomastix strix]